MTRLTWLLVALALLGMPAVALAADDVASTPHNLSTSGTGTIHATGGTDANQICVFCHTPHMSSLTGPLWNRTASAGPFTMYTSPTLDMIIGTSPQGVSAACLSCHDGTVAFDSLLNKPGMGAGAPTDWVFTGATVDKKMPAGVTNLGTDLSDDHPISITYDTTKDAAFNAIASGKVGTLPLYGAGKNQVECGTCHNPHDNSLDLFLRATNAASALCKTCHIK